MNKSHMNSSINNYLTNSSLFKNNQKNRLVSSYVSHRNYFTEQESSNGRKDVYIPNVTKSKKQQNSMPNGNGESRSIQENKADALQATIKREPKEQPVIEQNKKPLKIEASSNKSKSELASIQQVNRDNQELLQAQLAKEKSQKDRKIEIERQREQRERRERKQRQRQLQRKMEKWLQNQKQVYMKNETQRQNQRAKQKQLYEQRLRQIQRQLDRQKQKQKQVQGQNKSTHIYPINQAINSKIFVYYLQKGQNPILQDRDEQIIGKQLQKQNQAQYAPQNHHQYKQGQQESQTNIYLPTTQKKQRQTTKQPPSNLSLKKSKSINSQGNMIRQMPKSSPNSIKSEKKKGESVNEQTDYIISIRKDMNAYLSSIKQKLNNSYLCLQTVQYDFQSQIQKAIQIQCQKLKIILYRIIDEQIKDFKQFEKRQFLKSKFYFMSDLYEIKCNIDLRLEQIEHYQLQLKNQYKWKEFANNILKINYNQNINFLLKKSDQIQNQLTSNVNPQLSQYAQSINEEFITNIRQAIREQFGKVYSNVDKNRFKKRSMLVREPQ